MASQTVTVGSTTSGSIPLQSSREQYSDPDWSHTYVNYFQDAEAPPPDNTNSALSEHEIRRTRRSDDSPNVARTTVRIRNIRGLEDQYSLKKQGFCVARLDSSVQHWHDGELLKRDYFPEVAALLKREVGCKEVVSYEWHVRTGTLEEALEKDSTGKADIDGPVRRVHIDESPWSARNEFRHYVQPDAPGNEHLRGRHFGIYNVWKPLKTIRKDPLCLCDEATVHDEDLQLGKVTVPNVGEIQNFSIRPPKKAGAHEFAYLRGQKANEAYAFRIFDTRLDGGLGETGAVTLSKRSRGVAHTSFVDPGTEHEAPRESVEVRSFCIF